MRAKTDVIVRAIADLRRRTRRSQELLQRLRQDVADPRLHVCGHPVDAWHLPLVVASARGVTLTDVDGNEYIDFTMGFGVNLFGHAPSFVHHAITDALAAGTPVGHVDECAADVARLIATLTGPKRVMFCSTGSEAIMAAIRLARAHSGRTRLVVFSGATHGNLDSVLGRPTGRSPAPILAGIPQRVMQDLTVLPYGDSAALTEIDKDSSDIAAVLVEPFQASRLDFVSPDFLLTLASIARRRRIALILDEMVSGFRVRLGGAQSLFGVDADIVTYGKSIAGGLPLAVVAGRSEYMAHVDGNPPHSRRVTPRAMLPTTFGRFPLGLAAAHAVLSELQRAGDALQMQLDRRCTSLVDQLNTLLVARCQGLRVARFSSVFRFVRAPDAPWLDFFFLELTRRGIYVAESRGCFLCTAHDDRACGALVQAVAGALQTMDEAGLLAMQPDTAEPVVIPTPGT